MRKKLIVVMVSLLMAVLPVTAERKHYSDRANGYGGYASATYKGTANMTVLDYYDSEAYFFFQKTMLGAMNLVLTRRLKKASNAENFLIWKALDEYDIEDGEVYSVAVTCDNSSETLGLMVEIFNNGNSYRCYGGYYAKKK